MGNQMLPSLPPAGTRVEWTFGPGPQYLLYSGTVFGYGERGKVYSMENVPKKTRPGNTGPRAMTVAARHDRIWLITDQREFYEYERFRFRNMLVWGAEKRQKQRQLQKERAVSQTSTPSASDPGPRLWNRQDVSRVAQFCGVSPATIDVMMRMMRFVEQFPEAPPRPSLAVQPSTPAAA